ncbi:MAG TPA: hypothetical protein VMH84_03145 [Xanthobacteraceae bacterium]|nr:hypothetical protein [Xanthobacteraceae bacterium]
MIRVRGSSDHAALYTLAVPEAEHAIEIIRANVASEGQHVDDLGRVTDDLICRSIQLMENSKECRQAMFAGFSKGGVMTSTFSDEEVGHQILTVFSRNKISAHGALRRIDFFSVRDGDFQRGINKALANKWITLDVRNRYRYILTEMGYAVSKSETSKS